MQNDNVSGNVIVTNSRILDMPRWYQRMQVSRFFRSPRKRLKARAQIDVLCKMIRKVMATYNGRG